MSQMRDFATYVHINSILYINLENGNAKSQITVCRLLYIILATQVACEEFSQCYDDANICLWTEGSPLTQSAAQTACQQRNNSFLPRITDSIIQSKLAEFRNASDNLILHGWAFWIDVRAVDINNLHWIDGSPLAGLFVSTRVRCMRRRG